MSSSDTANDAAEPAATVLVYSDDASIREQVRLAIGRRPATDLPQVDYVETATEPVCIRHLDSGTFDLAILDGEANPAGGMGICREAKNSVFRCPPILVLIARSQDAWLANWSQADAVVSYPLDPVTVANAATVLLRKRLGTAVEPPARAAGELPPAATAEH